MVLMRRNYRLTTWPPQPRKSKKSSNPQFGFAKTTNTKYEITFVIKICYKSFKLLTNTGPDTSLYIPVFGLNGCIQKSRCKATAKLLVV
jgi:hypothetical protein